MEKTNFYKSATRAKRHIGDAVLKGVLKFVSKSVYWLLVIAVGVLIWHFAPWAAVAYGAAMGIPGLQ